MECHSWTRHGRFLNCAFSANPFLTFDHAENCPKTLSCTHQSKIDWYNRIPVAFAFNKDSVNGLSLVNYLRTSTLHMQFYRQGSTKYRNRGFDLLNCFSLHSESRLHKWLTGCLIVDLEWLVWKYRLFISFRPVFYRLSVFHTENFADISILRWLDVVFHSSKTNCLSYLLID